MIKLGLRYQIWLKAHGVLVTISGFDSSPWVDSVPLPVSESFSSLKSGKFSFRLKLLLSIDSGC